VPFVKFASEKATVETTTERTTAPNESISESDLSETENFDGALLVVPFPPDERVIFGAVLFAVTVIGWGAILDQIKKQNEKKEIRKTGEKKRLL
jgi:hypothetical protein